MKEKVKVYQLLDLDAPVIKQSVLIGSINDIRIWAKNLWKSNSNFAKSVVSDEDITEEEYYTILDDDAALMNNLVGIGYAMRVLCEIPFDDFYDSKKPSQELVAEVIERIKKDISEGDVTALDVLLNALPVQTLVSYLPEK